LTTKSELRVLYAFHEISLHSKIFALKSEQASRKFLSI